jgi:hypothetical protein
MVLVEVVEESVRRDGVYEIVMWLALGLCVKEVQRACR